MRSCWKKLVASRNWDPEIAGQCEEELFSLYESPTRHYHNLSHIEDCLRLFTESKIDDPVAVELAIWFHDVIYDPLKPDNEAASGIFAKLWLNQLEENTIFSNSVERLILVTDHNTEPETDDEATLVDIDLSILGSTPERYKLYSQQIRSEYSHVDDPQYKAGRIAVLKKFLDRSSIYKTEEYKNRFEASAQNNLEQEIAELAS